jgi:hypothetical protein
MMISSPNLRKNSPNTGVLGKNNNRFIFKKTAWFKFLSHIAYMPRANFINADLDFVLGDFG